MPVHYPWTTSRCPFHLTFIFHQLLYKCGFLWKDNVNVPWIYVSITKICDEMMYTWKPSFTVSNCWIGAEVGRRHFFGSHKMVLLNANPDISTWNLRSLLLFSFVCHPITWLPLQTGPSNIALFLLCASMATGHVPNRLSITSRSTLWISKK